MAKAIILSGGSFKFDALDKVQLHTASESEGIATAMVALPPQRKS